MGVKIISRESLAPWNSKVIPPVTRGLAGWWNFDTDSSRFALNRAVDGLNAAMVGSPAVGVGYGTFTSLANFLQTEVTETDEMTIIALCKSNGVIPSNASPSGDSTTPAFVTNYIGPAVTPGYTGNALGVGIFATSPTVLSGFACRDNGSGGATLAGAGLTDTLASWGFRGVRITNSLTTTFNRTAGSQNVATVTNKRIRNSQKLRIGSTTAAFGGKSDISAVAIYNAALSDEEIDKVIAMMRVRAQRFGIIA